MFSYGVRFLFPLSYKLARPRLTIDRTIFEMWIPIDRAPYDGS